MRLASIVPTTRTTRLSRGTPSSPGGRPLRLASPRGARSGGGGSSCATHDSGECDEHCDGSAGTEACSALCGAACANASSSYLVPCVWQVFANLSAACATYDAADDGTRGARAFVAATPAAGDSRDRAPSYWQDDDIAAGAQAPDDDYYGIDPCALHAYCVYCSSGDDDAAADDEVTSSCRAVRAHAGGDRGEGGGGGRSREDGRLPRGLPRGGNSSSLLECQGATRGRVRCRGVALLTPPAGRRCG